jgi:type IV secretion system protein VirB11
MESSARDRNTAALLDSLSQHLPQLADPTVTDIYVNADQRLWVQRWGAAPQCEDDNFSVKTTQVILRAAAGVSNTEITHHHPIIAATLPDGTRLQGFVPPVTTEPVFALRCHRPTNLTLADYLKSGILTANQAALLRSAVIRKDNILIAGATGAGKTTLANAILAELGASNDRVVILEDTTELQCAAADTIALRSTKEASLRDLVRAALRIRPDRIVIGEIRSGAVAKEILNAWSTGHPGGLSTIHADNAQSTLPRLEHLLSEEYSTTPTQLIADAIDLVVYLPRYNQDNGRFTALSVTWDPQLSDYHFKEVV